MVVIGAAGAGLPVAVAHGAGDGGCTREQVVAAMADGPDAVLALIAQAVADSGAALGTLRERVRALEAAQATDSHNSGKPPSSDVTRTGRAPRSMCGRSGKRPGGQPAHPGRTLALHAVPDAVVTHAPAVCARCGRACAPAAPAAKRRQVFELPPVALVCTEHRAAECVCAGGGAHAACGGR